MPVIKIYGAFKYSKWVDDNVWKKLAESVAEIKGLGIKPSDVTIVYFDSATYPGRQVIAEISGLYEKPERDEFVRKELARVVGEFIKKHDPRAQTIEVFVHSFNPISGFWQYRR